MQGKHWMYTLINTIRAITIAALAVTAIYFLITEPVFEKGIALTLSGLLMIGVAMIPMEKRTWSQLPLMIGILSLTVALCFWAISARLGSTTTVVVSTAIAIALSGVAASYVVLLINWVWGAATRYKATRGISTITDHSSHADDFGEGLQTMYSIDGVNLDMAKALALEVAKSHFTPPAKLEDALVRFAPGPHEDYLLVIHLLYSSPEQSLDLDLVNTLDREVDESLEAVGSSLRPVLLWTNIDDPQFPSYRDRLYNEFRS